MLQGKDVRWAVVSLTLAALFVLPEMIRTVRLRRIAQTLTVLVSITLITVFSVWPFPAPKLSRAERQAIEHKLLDVIGKGDAAKARYQAAFFALVRDPKAEKTQIEAFQSVQQINNWRTETGNLLLAKPFKTGTKDYVLTQDADLVTPQLEKLREVFRDLERWIDP